MPYCLECDRRILDGNYCIEHKLPRRITCPGCSEEYLIERGMNIPRLPDRCKACGLGAVTKHRAVGLPQQDFIKLPNNSLLQRRLCK